MTHVKKMLLMDPRVLESRTQHAPTPPLVSALANSDQGMNQALYDDEMTDEERLDAYRRELASYRNFQSQRSVRQPVPVRLTNPAKAEAPTPPILQQEQGPVLSTRYERVVADIPKSYKRRARVLLNSLSTDPRVNFDERQQLVYQGKPVVGSNIVDLVNDVVHPRNKHSKPHPPGSRPFAALLQRLNTPRVAMGNNFYHTPQPIPQAEVVETDGDDDDGEYESDYEEATGNMWAAKGGPELGFFKGFDE
jgi:hypothetical protein